MRNLLVLALACTTLLPACPLAPGCGAYTGGSDTVYQRGTDSLILCSNGGYAAVLATGSQEGLYGDGAGTIGATGAVAFHLTQNADGSMVGLGDGAWQPVTLDQTALDHADVQCSDLQTRSWWSATASFALPVETAFSKPVDQFQTIDACIAAQEAGTWPSGASCEDQVLLCPDGRALVSSNDVTMSGHYIAATGELSVEPDSSGFVSFSGTFTSDGAYASTGLVSAASVTWHTTSTFANGMHCQ